MSNITYTLGIPDGDHNPSEDYANMQTNNDHLSQILSVDLIGFNVLNSGMHQKVSFPANVSPTPPTSLASVIYTQPGTADSSKSQILWQNGNQIPYNLGPIKAFGSFPGISGSGAITFSSQMNCVSGSKSGSTYTINITPNAIFGNFPTVIVSTSGNLTYTYSYSANVLTITGNIGSSSLVNFMLLQV